MPDPSARNCCGGGHTRYEDASSGAKRMSIESSATPKHSARRPEETRSLGRINPRARDTGRQMKENAKPTTPSFRMPAERHQTSQIKQASSSGRSLLRRALRCAR